MTDRSENRMTVPSGYFSSIRDRSPTFTSWPFMTLSFFLSGAPAFTPFEKTEAVPSSLVTTAADWWRFLEMLRNNGRFGNVRILSRNTAQLICSDHLQEIPGAFEPGTGHGFNNDTNAGRYNEAAAKLAWERTVGFFKEKLK